MFRAVRFLLIALSALSAIALAACSAPSKIDPKLVAATAPETERAAIARLMRISSHFQREPFTYGNSVRLLQDGPETYAAMLAAIDGAQRRIDMESYQFDTAGAALFVPILLQKRREGVEVHLIYDAWGSSSQDKSLFDQLRAGGVEVVEFNPIGSGLDLDHRDHRKLLVIDNRLVITGGVNITGVYLNRVNTSPSDPEQMRWRDTDIEIEGPVASEFEALFAKTWAAQKGPALLEPPSAPTTMSGPAVVQAIDGAPQDNHPVIYETLLSAVALAKRSVHLTTGFFGPPPELVEALEDAARRGVDVVVVAPGNSDSQASVAAGRSHFATLLSAGVRIVERQGAVLHAKTAVVDGVWCVVGSSNLDWRSTVLNNEIDAVVVDGTFGRAMEAMFAADVAQSREITPQAWAERGLGERAAELWARLIEQQL
jgi:cardiolipin synthase